MTSEKAVTATLSDQVRLARTRMLFSHIPIASTVAGGLGCVVLALVHVMAPQADMRLPMAWILLLLLLTMTHVHRSLRYFKSRQRGQMHWLRSLKRSVFALSVMWGAMLWVLPLGQRVDLQAALIGSLTGMAACGAFMLTVERGAARLWFLPMLSSTALYCLVQQSTLGVFGFVSLVGFMAVLWIETNRAHRRMGELLYLRFTNDRVTASQAVALREAEELSRAKEKFLATMSHEMRTPLHGILGLSRLIRPELSSQEAHERMNLLQAAGQHLLTVINDVLDYSRLQAGRIELSTAPVNLSELAREVTALAAVNGLEKGLEVVCHADLPSPCWVEADGGRLRQVLLNLLGNAVKFTEQGSVVLRLRDATTPDGRAAVALEVADTGIGIPPHELSQVFEAFHQVDGRFERKAAGSGLGLSIARELCVAMGGDLACESTPGKGSVFRCVLPLRRISPPQVVQDQMSLPSALSIALPDGPDVRGAMVLLVEDNPVNALVARSELEQMGMQVEVASNGRLALDWLATHRADLVFMDCHMPEMNGFDAARQIRAIERQRGGRFVPIVALTASNHEEVRQECLQAGMNDCLSKPFQRADLRRVMARYVVMPATTAGGVPSGTEGRSEPAAPVLAATSG